MTRLTSTPTRPLSFAVRVAAVFIAAAVTQMSPRYVTAADLPRDKVEFFESRIRPVLVEHCYSCHNSSDKAEGGLRLDSRDGLLKGGDRGPALIVGKPESSLIVSAMRHETDDLRMPQDGAKQKPNVIADFVKWIADGAVDPRDKPPSKEELAEATSWETLRERRRSWWSFRPLSFDALTLNKDDRRHPVDRVLETRWQNAGVKPVENADRRTLIRRLSFVLTGLPPTPEEVDLFVNDERDGAYERVVDRLLQSPEFGVKWARHWLDWFRYAETHGSEGDPAIPNAWRYRDYLIRALNADIPYPQLVREHVAGDLLPQPRVNAELGINESALGTAHYRIVQHGYVPTDALDEMVRFTDNQIDTLSKAFLGVTLSCARCHHHKFDPLSQHDFYAWYGIMSGCRPGMITVDLPERRASRKQDLVRLKAEIKSAVAGHWMRVVNSPSFDMNGMRGAFEEAGKSDGRLPLHALSVLQGKEGAEFANEWKRLSDQYRARNMDREKFRNATFSYRAGSANDSFQSWFRDGTGMEAGPTTAGEFAVVPDGQQLIANIYPAGVYTHSLSSKQNGVFTSPTFKIDGDEICVRVSGGNSRVRYVVQNYVRAILIYPSATLNHEDTRWYRWDSKYWKGDEAHIEIATAGDLPTDQPGDTSRSWFGMVEVVSRQSDQPGPVELGAPLFAVLRDEPAPRSNDDLSELYRKAILSCLTAWQSGSMDDDQAEFLGYFVQRNLLPNTLDANPAAAKLVESYRQIERDLLSPVRAPGIHDGTAQDRPLFERGNHRKPTEIVPRHFLEVFDATPYKTHGSGRLELANSLSDVHNPLLARVIVNRIWHHLFGAGLCRTPDNLGQLGDEPIYPELIDYLAATFSGTLIASTEFGGASQAKFSTKPWSIKSAVRSLVMTNAFRRQSQVTQETASLDPENRFWTHYPLRRLEAESIRDSMLAVSGQLDRTKDGPSVGGDSRRRSIFVQVRRNSLDPFLTAFDSPEPHMTQGRRDTTNVPAQSLMLLNDPFVIDQAKAWARRVNGAESPSIDGDVNKSRRKIQQMYLEAFGRSPSNDEVEKCLDFLREFQKLDGETRRQAQMLDQQTASLQRDAEQLIEPVRKRLVDSRRQASDGPKPASSAIPAPLAHWDFQKGIDSVDGRWKGVANGGAKIEGSALRVKGGAYVEVPAQLQAPLREKSLEVWVQCDDLDQRAGGVMTVQTRDGAIFDAIVYAEQEAKHWLPGSNVFARTQPLRGMPEADAKDRPVHLVLTYQADGRITAYRDGKLYGNSYVSNGPATFQPGNTSILFGLRHSPPGGNRFFAGRIFEAKLYDRALSAEHVAASFRRDPHFVSIEQVIASLSPDQRTSYESLQKRLTDLARHRAALGPVAERSEPPDLWQDLAHSLFNVKEFIYLR